MTEEKKKKLLIAVDTWLPKRDGVIVFLEKIIPRLVDDFDVTVIAPNFPDHSNLKGVNLILLPLSKAINVSGYSSVKFSYTNVKRVKKAVKEADIVWSQDLALIGTLSIYFAKKYHIPSLNYVHQITWEQFADILPIPNFSRHLFAWFIRHLVKYLYNRCDFLMIPYKDLADDLSDRGVFAKKVIIPLGVNTERFIPADKTLAKTNININPSSIVIGYCGRVSREKDLPTLKKAFTRLKEQYKDITLLIVGGGMKSEVEKIKDKDIVITDFVHDTLKYYQAMDIFVLPSLTETTSLATLEAMSVNLPVLVTKVGFIPNYIINRYNGMFFPVQNDYVLRKKLEMLYLNPDLRIKLGNAARDTVVERFSWTSTVSMIKKALNMI